MIAYNNRVWLDDMFYSGSSNGTGTLVLEDDNPLSYWEVQSSPGSIEDLYIDLGEAIEVQAWGLVNIVGQCSTATLEVGEADNGHTFDTTAATISSPSEGTILQPCLLFAPTRTKRYWRARFANPPSGFRISIIYLAGTLYEFDDTPDFPTEERWDDQVAIGETKKAGIVRARRGPAFREHRLVWKAHGSDLRDELVTIYDTQDGGARSVIYAPTASNTSNGYEAYPVRLLGRPVSERLPGGVYTSQLELGELVG
jgi:hypothetical protein